MECPPSLGSWRRRMCFAALATVVVFVLARFPGTPPEGADFFYGAGRLSGGDLYDWDKQVQSMSDYNPVYKVFPRPPFIAALMKPFTALPYSRALILWQSLNAIALAGFLFTFSRDPEDMLRVATFLPLIMAVAIAQDTPILLLAVAVVVRLLERSPNSVAAGVVAAFLSEKPHLFSLLPVALLRWRKAFVALLATGVGLFIACSLWAGWDWPLRMVSISRRWDADYVYQTPNLYGLVAPIESAAARWLLWAVGAVLVLAFTRHAAGDSPRTRIPVAIFGSIAIGYRALTFDSALILPFLMAFRAPLWVTIPVGLAGAISSPPLQLLFLGAPMLFVVLREGIGKGAIWPRHASSPALWSGE